MKKKSKRLFNIEYFCASILSLSVAYPYPVLDAKATTSNHTAETLFERWDSQKFLPDSDDSFQSSVVNVTLACEQ